MLTSLGRVLRKIRIDHGEILKDMADRFGVTASYLSAVENGKRPVPESWEGIILASYPLDANQVSDLRKSVIESTNLVQIDIKNEDFSKKEVTFAFARTVADLPEEKIAEIKRILGGE